MIRKVWWLSNKQMTVKVSTDTADIIRDAAPIVRRFIGQRFDNLWSWMNRMSETNVAILREYEK